VQELGWRDDLSIVSVGNGAPIEDSFSSNEIGAESVSGPSLAAAVLEGGIDNFLDFLDSSFPRATPMRSSWWVEDEVDAPFLEGEESDLFSVDLCSLVLLGREIDKGRPTVAAESVWRSSTTLDETIESVAERFCSRAINVFNVYSSGGEADEDQSPLLRAFLEFKRSKMVHADFEPGSGVSVETAWMQGCGGRAQRSRSTRPAVEAFLADLLDRSVALRDVEARGHLGMGASGTLVLHLTVRVSDDQLGQGVISWKCNWYN
jgi:hypothetical protein